MNLAPITYLHYQPKAGPFSYFDISSKPYYSKNELNLGSNSLLTSTVEPWIDFLEANGNHKLNLCLSIPALEFLKGNAAPLRRLQKLFKAGQLEILAGRGYNSLTILYSRALLQRELASQTALIVELFGTKPTGFLNTALLYSDKIGQAIEEEGFKYAIVPKISWFVEDNNQSMFKPRQGALNLFVATNTPSSTPTEPAEVLIAEPAHWQNFTEKTKFILLSELKAVPDQAVYSVPDLVAQDTSIGGFEMIVGNNLQKDFQGRLTELGTRVVASDDQKLMADYLWLGSLPHYAALSNKSNDRYKIYTKLLTILYDLEIRLR